MQRTKLRGPSLLNHLVSAQQYLALPEVQGAAAREWLAGREAELLPVPYFYVVYTLPASIAD